MKIGTDNSTSSRISYASSVHGSQEIAAVVRVLRGNTSIGEQTMRFEKNIAHIFGKRYGVMVNSGSSANLLAVELMNLPRGAEVITPLLTFSTTVAPLIQKGLVPVFVDVKPGTYIIDVAQVERAITKKTRALMIPSLLGNIPDYRLLHRIARKHRLWLIEDSCDTLGAKLYGKPTGVYSDISTTGFYGSHIINGAGGGGMVIVNDRALAERTMILRGWGRESSRFGESHGSENLEKRFRMRLGRLVYDAKFIFSEIGYNFLPLEVSAAFALVQLGRLKQFQKIRTARFRELLRFFQYYEQFFVVPQQTLQSQTSWLAFPLTIREGAPFSRNQICLYLEKNNIQTRPIFTGSIMRQPAFRNIEARLLAGGYPETEHVMAHGFLIGCHQGLTSLHSARIQKVIRTFLKKVA